MIAKEIVRLHLKLRKAEYIAECIKNGEIKDTEENKKCFDNITHYKELLQQLEQQSELPSIRQSIQKVMRKSLICYNWEQVKNVLDCFNKNDSFDIREKSGIFYIQGECGTAQKKKFIAAYEGRLDEAEREKPSGR